ncbi:MAG TPA: transglutaminase-like domain-containing protein [Desulfuromonadaceae bacterium]
MRKFLMLCFTIFIIIAANFPAAAQSIKKLDKPPLGELWYGIYVDNDRVGFYRQKISESPEGYRLEGDGSVHMKVMGFSKEASMRESYLVGKNLALKSFEIEQNINNIPLKLTGRVGDGTIRIRKEHNKKTTDSQLKFKGDVFPGPAINLYPMMRDIAPGKSFKLLTFDPEEVKIKEVKVNVIGVEKAPSGKNALKLRNNLYPFVNNDIWMDGQGNSIYESVRDGLVVTKAEDPKELAQFVGNLALAKKDLIYDFSLVRVDPPIKEQSKLKGLAVMINGWSDELPLLQGGGQLVEKSGEGRITVRTGSLVPATPELPVTAPAEEYLKPTEKIESDAPEIIAKVKEITAGKSSQEEIAKILSSWTAEWLHDSIEDGGGAQTSFVSRTGNCQTHARLYTAMARAAGLPTRFVSGLVYLEGKGFLYHSWSESWLKGHWVAIDPTYNQLPADPTHLKFFEGHTPNDMAPIIAIIGKIKISVLETKY